MAMRNLKSFISRAWIPDFLAGLGSVFDITGSGRWFPVTELDFQPTELFKVKHGETPVASRGFLADRDALAKDWEKVGNDLREAMNDYRGTIGSHATMRPQPKSIHRT